MKVGIIVFPGSNGDHDAQYALGEVLGQQAELVWQTATDVSGYDMVVLPGGFSYGDHLRAGAIARFAPVTEAVRRFAEAGGWVLGICNGFQVLTESHLLPGALMRNAELAFSCKWVHARVEASCSSMLATAQEGTVWRLPIAHGEGRYFADPEALRQLEEHKQIVLRYCDAAGHFSPGSNPNGSSEGIAGICNRAGNVLGLMPHPERAAESVLGGDDGRLFLEAVVAAWQQRGRLQPAEPSAAAAR